MELIPVSKAGEYIEVHPATLAEHKQLGWAECEKREPTKADKPAKQEKQPKQEAKADKPAEAPKE